MKFRINRLQFVYILVAAMFLVAAFLYTQVARSQFIYPWDEIVHVNVVKNLSEDCCTPVLHTQDLGTDYKVWTNNYVWLHKPPLPLIVQSFFFKNLGKDIFAFRLPGALAALGVGFLLLYFGRRHFGVIAGVTAAVLFLFSPYVLMQVAGMEFAGFMDILLVLFTLCALGSFLEFTRSGRQQWLLVTGILFGMAYLTKSGLALPPLLVVAAYLLFLTKNKIVNLLHLSVPLGIIGAINYMYYFTNFNKEFVFEQKYQLSHIFRNVEQWLRPMDNYITQYMYRLSGYLSVPVFVVSALVALWKRERTGLVLVLWVLVYVVPFSFFISKVNNFIFPALPALCLLAGMCLQSIWKNKDNLVGLMLFVAVAVCGLVKISFSSEMFQYFPLQVNLLQWERFWWIMVVVVSLVFGAGSSFLLRKSSVRWVMPLFLVAGIIFLFDRAQELMILFRQVPENSGQQLLITYQAKKLSLPPGTVILFGADAGPNAHLYMQYFSGYNTYPKSQPPKTSGENVFKISKLQ